MKFKKIAIALIVLIPFVAFIGCQPTAQPTGNVVLATQPATTQPSITPGQVANGAADAVLAYGPAAQVILAAIPSAAGAAVGVGIAMAIASSYKKYSATGKPFDFASAAELVASQVATAFPGTAKTTTEITAMAKIVEAALTAHVATSATS